MNLFYAWFALSFSLVWVHYVSGQTTGQFEAPVMLRAGDKPFNDVDFMMFPSPAVFDIDQDDVDELVIGSLFGYIFVCEKSSIDLVGEPVWAMPVQVNAADGKPLRLNNW